MPLVIVNPSTTKARRRRTATARKATKGEPMMKRRRSPAQKRAFAKMIARNPKRRRRVVHANPVRHVSRRRTIRRNPAPFRHRRRHRNPSGDGFLGNLFDTKGLMLLGAVVATPTIMAEGQSMIAPGATGYFSAGIQGAIGVGLGWVAYKFLDKQVGTMVAAIGVGTAVAQLISGYNAGTLSASKLSGFGFPGNLPRRPVVGSQLPNQEAGARTLSGYTGAGIGGRAASVMSGYTGRPMLESGARRL
jgi:hypothetical protein